VPVPETPEERAALAPAVLEFRRSQTQAPKQESNIPGILGAVAGVGALAGLGTLAAKRFGLASRPAKESSLSREGMQRVEKIGMIGRQAANEAVVKEARQQRPQGVVQTDLSVINNLLQDKSLLAAVEAQEAVESLTPQGLKEFRGAESRARNEYRSAITQIGDEIIAQERASSQLPVISQALGALESGEDQMTGRVLRGVQRNEDLDSSQVNQVARKTGNAEVAASLTPDGIPKDQLELNQPYTAQEMVDLAKQEMLTRRQSLEQAGLRPGTVRFERALAQPMRTSQSTQVAGTGPVELALPAGPIRQTVQAVSSSEPLIERSVLNIGPQAVVTSTAAGTAIRGASPSYYEALPKQELRQLYGSADPLVPGAPDELVPDLPASLRIRGGIAPDVEPELLSKQEIQYSVLDRPQVPGPAGGSSGIGIYGIEPGFVPGAVTKSTGEYSEASSRKPSYVPGWLQRKEGRTGFENLTSTQLATAAENAKVPRVQAAFESELGKREVAKQSMEVSEALRRARIEGRDPQMVLRQRGFSV
jgi:hypothetical protein